MAVEIAEEKIASPKITRDNGNVYVELASGLIFYSDDRGNNHPWLLDTMTIHLLKDRDTLGPKMEEYLSSLVENIPEPIPAPPKFKVAPSIPRIISTLQHLHHTP